MGIDGFWGFRNLGIEEFRDSGIEELRNLGIGSCLNIFGALESLNTAGTLMYTLVLIFFSGIILP